MSYIVYTRSAAGWLEFDPVAMADKISNTCSDVSEMRAVSDHFKKDVRWIKGESLLKLMFQLSNKDTDVRFCTVEILNIITEELERRSAMYEEAHTVPAELTTNC